MNKKKLIRNWHCKKISNSTISFLTLIILSIFAVQIEGNIMPSPIINYTSNTTLLGTFYYPWTGGNSQISPTDTWKFWADGHNPPRTWESNYLPDVLLSGSWDPYNRLYSSKDANITKKQLYYMKKAGIQFVISSWWGNGDYTDQSLNFTLNKVLPLTSNPYPEIRFTIYYEKDAYRNVPKSEIISDVNYIKTKYANSPFYLKINQKPVIFVYNTGYGETSLQQAQKWSDVRNATGIYLVLKVFSGYQNAVYLADSWHQYAPTLNYEKQGKYSALVSPGFYKFHESSPRLVRENFTRFEKDVATLKNASVQFKLIETWNEWGEGTGVEPAQLINHDDISGFSSAAPSYGTKYIDIIGKYFSNPTPTPTPTYTIAFLADAKPALGSNLSVLKEDFNQIIPQSPTGRVDAVVMIGDMNPIITGKVNTVAAYSNSTARNIPAFFVIGNHELNNINDLPADRFKFVSYAYSPKPGPIGSRNTTYSFNVGNIHIVTLNEYWDGNSNNNCDWYTPSGGLDNDDSCFKNSTGNGGFIPDTLFNWLNNDLDSNNKKWIIVVGHEPLYPWGGHVGDSLDANVTNRDTLENIFISKRVTAFIGGHTHRSGFKIVDNIFHANAGVIGDNVGNGDNFATIIYAYANTTGYFILEQKYENPTWSTPGSKKLIKSP